MKALQILLLAAVATIGVSTAARATDLYVAPALVAADEGHDWGGFYIGKLFEISFAIPGESCDCSRGESFFGFSKVFGYNWDDGDIIYGIDKIVTFTPLPNDEWKISIQKMARLGVEVGNSAMIYGAAGLGWMQFMCSSCSGFAYGAVAGGLEVAVAENLNWRTHVQYSWPLNGFPATVLSVGTGLVWQFN